LIGDDLRIAEITVDDGPTLKRWRARARGRATPIHKRTCHVKVALTPTEEA
jgi:large subunit ribosomal protein L22